MKGKIDSRLCTFLAAMGFIIWVFGFRLLASLLLIDFNFYTGTQNHFDLELLIIIWMFSLSTGLLFSVYLFNMLEDQKGN